MREFGELKSVNLRDVWPKEATDFTPWLADNIEALSQALGVDLELVGTEQGVGDFSLDLLAKDLGTGRPVIIENQLTPTNHDHLGKLLTYAAGFDASVVVWLAEAMREEHRQALEWLNQRTDQDTAFFAVVVEVLQIDDSRPAYNFKPVVSPNEWQKSKRGPRRGGTSDRGEAYRAFFQKLIDELREKHRFTNARVSRPQNWYMFASGFPGVNYAASFASGNRMRVEVYLDRDDAETTKSLFDDLEKDRAAIESEFGSALEWERLDSKRASRVAIYRPAAIMDDDSALAEIQTWTVERLLTFKRVFGPRLRQRS